VTTAGVDEQSSFADLQLRPPVDHEGIEVARVDPDRVGSELDGAPELVSVMRFHEGVQPESLRGSHQQARLVVVQVAQQEQHGIGAGLAQRRQVSRFAEEALREQRQPRRLSRRPQVVDRAPEALVHQDRDRSGACAFEFGSEGCRISSGTKISG